MFCTFDPPRPPHLPPPSPHSPRPEKEGSRRALARDLELVSESIFFFFNKSFMLLPLVSLRCLEPWFLQTQDLFRGLAHTSGYILTSTGFQNFPQHCDHKHSGYVRPCLPVS